MSRNSTIPAIQTAWRCVRRGPPSESLELHDNVPVMTELCVGEVLVNIKAAALNPAGYKLMKLLPNIVAKRPHTAEYDFAGVVVDQMGTAFKIGDEVYGELPAGPTFPSRGQGALASYITVSSNLIARKPYSLGWTEAAGLCLAGRTAMEGLVGIAKIQPDQRVLINGGSSATGIAAIQIAKAYGCTVTAIASSKNEDLVKNLGADEFVDYTMTPPEKLFSDQPPLQPFDVIIDTIGKTNDLYLRCEAYLHPNGIFVAIGGDTKDVGISFAIKMMRTYLQPVWAGGVNRRHKRFLVEQTGKYLPDFATLVNEGKVRPVVDSVHEFENVHKAYDRIMTGHAAGKVVVTISPSASDT